MKKIIISILFTICLAFGISAFAACGNSGGIGGNSTWNNNVSTENQYNENITYKLSYTSEEECPNGNISDNKLHSSLNFEVDRTYYMVLDFTVLSFPGNWEILQAIVEFDPAEYITARLEEAATGSTGEREENGEKIITASYSIPEQRNEPKSYRVIYKFSGEQNLPEGGISFNIGIAFITTANAIPEFQYLSFNSEKLVYEINSSGYTVTGFELDVSYSNLVIPKGYNGKPVTSIGNKAFYNCDGLTSITIPNSVTSIAEDAFEGCVNIKNATIPTTAIKNIPKDNLQTVILTGDNIGWYAFSGCTKLESVTISSGVTSIGEKAFYNCENLKSITIGNGVTSIGSSAFYNTAYYNNPENWTSEILYIGDYLLKAWQHPLNGYSYNILPGTQLIADGAFKGCRINSITIPDSVTYIGDSAFMDCSTTSITIPDSVAYIGAYAFSGCSITSITIPGSVTSIGDYAFKSCKSLASVILGNGVVFIGDCAFEHCIRLESITIPDGVNSICNDAFKDTAYYNNPNNWTNDVLYIDNYLIEAKRTLSGSYEIRQGSKSIADCAFYYCTNLTSISIPDSVISIGDYAFYDCESLESVTIGNSVSSIGDSAFFSCTSLTSINIPYSVTSIGDYAFYKCTSLTSVTIPDSVTYIGNEAFYNCENLENITIGNSVTSIGDSAFEYCERLTSITIPDSVTSIGQEAFYGCKSLASVTIGNCVTSIGDSAFNYCTNLESVFITDIAAWCNIDFGSYDANPLYYAHNLYLKNQLVTNLSIPQGVTTIKKYTFYHCKNLTTITIGNGVTFIGDCAFYDCTSLTSITIPDSVTSIGSGAFDDCFYLKSVTFENTSGWKVSKNEDMSEAEIIDLADPVQNAKFLTDTYRGYCGYYWKRY